LFWYVSNPGEEKPTPSDFEGTCTPVSAGSYVLHINKVTAEVKETLLAGLTRALEHFSRYTEMVGMTISPVEMDDLVAFFHSCESQFVRGNAEKAAKAASDGFTWCDDDLDRDGVHLQKVGSIDALVCQRRSINSVNRFNKERCQTYFSEVSNAAVLMDLAEWGARLPVADDFVFQMVPDKPRTLQKKLGMNYSKQVKKLWDKGGVLVFRKEHVSHLEMAKLNFNPFHWTPKPGPPPEPMGRLLGDLSNREEGPSINCLESKHMVEDIYGTMSYPTIEEIVTSWLLYSKSNGYLLSDCLIWKEDIRSAFGQFDFHPEETYKLAFEFAVGLIMIMMIGFFGWTGAPLVFANFSRALIEVLRKDDKVLGVVHIFCDDFMGLAHRTIARNDQLRSRRLIEGVFGEGTAALEKAVDPCLKADIIGWSIDLVTAKIRPSDKGIRKLMFSFFMVDALASHWPLAMCQLLSSLAQRYSAALVGMRPFVSAFYEMCSGSESVNLRRVTPKARFAVEIWRVTSLRLYWNKESMAIPLKVMIGSSEGMAIRTFISDAMHLGVGFGSLTAEREVEFHSSYEFQYSVLASKYQNHREFLGFIMAILFLVSNKKIPSEGVVLHWVNDNTSALEWAKDNMCKGGASQIAFMLYTVLALKFKINVVLTTHTAGVSELMLPIDALSRGLPLVGLDSSARIELKGLSIVHKMMDMCNPSKIINCQGYHEAYYTTFQLVEDFYNECI